MLQDALTELHVSGTCKPTQKAFFFISLVCVSSTTTFQVNKTQSCGIPIPLSSLYSTQKLSTRWRYITLLFPFCYDVLWMYNELSTLSWLNMPDITICHGPGRAGLFLFFSLSCIVSVTVTVAVNSSLWKDSSWFLEGKQKLRSPPARFLSSTLKHTGGCFVCSPRNHHT